MIKISGAPPKALSSKELTPQTLFTKLCSFEKTVTSVRDLPTGDLPEIAFIGRSNVGKSSLLNALCGRVRLARMSHTPGRTQALNFFNLDNLCYLVDLPGYGYAKVARSKALAWGETVEAYLNDRPTLMRVFVLVDSRHGLKPLDEWMMSLLDKAAQSYQIILTKTDKVSKSHLLEIKEQVARSLKGHVAAYPEILATSSRDKKGIDDLRKSFFEALFPKISTEEDISKIKIKGL
ncbi:MAG: YihA family ribosome biogenesis GTP-binding protein [Proteobacteria bacterium]|nr:YihA family ribosome biogenesis GTP-binding protein [Pseudomonadota bacterium]